MGIATSVLPLTCITCLGNLFSAEASRRQTNYGTTCYLWTSHLPVRARSTDACLSAKENWWENRREMAPSNYVIGCCSHTAHTQPAPYKQCRHQAQQTSIKKNPRVNAAFNSRTDCFTYASWHLSIIGSLKSAHPADQCQKNPPHLNR